MRNDNSRKQRWTDFDAETYQKGTGSYADEVDSEIVREFVSGGDTGWVLDLPCGSGRLYRILAEKGRAVGADYSPTMLEVAVRQPGFCGVRCDAFRLPFRDGCFARTVCLRLSFHYEDWDVILGEVARVTSSEGQILFDTLGRGSLRWLLSRPLDLLRRTGSQAVVFRSRRQVESFVHGAGLDVVVVRSRFLLPTRAYQWLPKALCRLLSWIEHAVPNRFRVVTYWQIAKR